VVRWLVEEEDVRLEQNGARERELHLPTTGERADTLALAHVVEADGRECLDDLLLARLNALRLEDEVEDSRLLLSAVDVVLDVERADLVRGREALDLARGT
jgi:hypothetical protein